MESGCWVHVGTCIRFWGNLSWVGHGVAPLSSLEVLFSEGTRQSPSPCHLDFTDYVWNKILRNKRKRKK